MLVCEWWFSITAKRNIDCEIKNNNGLSLFAPKLLALNSDVRLLFHSHISVHCAACSVSVLHRALVTRPPKIYSLSVNLPEYRCSHWLSDFLCFSSALVVYENSEEEGKTVNSAISCGHIFWQKEWCNHIEREFYIAVFEFSWNANSWVMFTCLMQYSDLFEPSLDCNAKICVRHAFHSQNSW